MTGDQLGFDNKMTELLDGVAESETQSNSDETTTQAVLAGYRRQIATYQSEIAEYQDEIASLQEALNEAEQQGGGYQGGGGVNPGGEEPEG